MRLPENESAISMLIQYIGDNYFEPRKNWPPDIFEEHIYERAAANEILQLLLDNPEDLPSWIVQQYYDKVSYYWAISGEGSRQEMIFSIAILVADDILHNVICYA